LDSFEICISPDPYFSSRDRQCQTSDTYVDFVHSVFVKMITHSSYQV